MSSLNATAVGVNESRRRVFYLTMAVVISLVVFAGFSRTYYLKAYTGSPTLTPLVHVHGFLFSSWIVVFVLQTALVAGHRVRTPASGLGRKAYDVRQRI